MPELPHAWLLRLLKTPLPPSLDTAQVRVFRSAPAYRQYRLLFWAVKQAGLVAGLLFGALFLNRFVLRIEHPLPQKLIWAVEAFAWLGFLVQLPVGFLVARIDYAFRWYILSDKSLRVREGVLSFQEKTMTFANIQQVSIQQNPLQRLLGIADVKVETAGGGSHKSEDSGASHGEGLHEAYFRGVSNAGEIRDTILARVRQQRDAGLGEATPAPTAGPEAALAAARELLTEMKALRRALPAEAAPRKAEGL
jgi:membrane protein YdbS with pleckstrin-like domain